MDFFINMTDGINNHFTVAENPNAVSGVNWPSTLSDLTKIACPNGPVAGRLEINAHGFPAEISLRPKVTQANVVQFASMVRQLLLPGGVIEILSCSISSMPLDLLEGTSAVPAGGIEALAKEARGYRRHLRSSSAPLPASKFTAEQMTAMAQLCIDLPRSAMTQEQFDYNGPLFCATLASETGCRVRAAIQPQAEEWEKTGNRKYSTPFGNWDGHVFDYLPGKRVRYAGFNVARPVFRTHDEYGDGPLRVA